MDYKLEGLKAFNSDFMMAAVEEIGTNPDFVQMLRRAANNYSQSSRYDGLQRFSPTLGFIFVNAISADNVLGLMQSSPRMLPEFMQKVHEGDSSMYARDDHSKIVLPFKDRLHGPYNLVLDITEYTHGSDGGFEPVNPMDLPIPIGLERIANFEFEHLR